MRSILVKIRSDLFASNSLLPADRHGLRDQPRTGMVKSFPSAKFYSLVLIRIMVFCFEKAGLYLFLPSPEKLGSQIRQD